MYVCGQITKSDLEQQREAFNKEASARSAAEAQQAELQRKLQEASNHCTASSVPGFVGSARVDRVRNLGS